LANEVRIVVSADDKASAKLHGIAGGVSGLSSKLRSVMLPAAVAAGAGLGILGAGLASSIKQAMESQKVQAQLAAVLKSTSGAAGVTAKGAKDLASSLQSLTTFDDEAILSAENLLLTFTNVGKKVFPDATRAILDMSTAMGQDLQTTTVQVGKALQSPIEGVTSLQRVGVRLSETQKQQVKDFMAVGDAASAQRLILKELSTEFGGSAAAAADTFGGRMTQLKNALGEVQESIGNALLPVLQSLAEKTAEWLSTHEEDIQAVIDKWVTFSTNKAFPAIKQFFIDITPVATAWWDTFKTGLEVVKPVFEYIAKNKMALIGALLAIGVASAVAFGPWVAALVAVTAIITGLGVIKKLIDEAAAERAKKGNTYWGQWAEDLGSMAKSLASIAAGPFGGLFRKRQHGGLINTPFTLVGERGPELIAGGMGGRVFSNAETLGMIAGGGRQVTASAPAGGGQSIVYENHFHFTGPILGDQHQANELVQWFLPALRQALR